MEWKAIMKKDLNLNGGVHGIASVPYSFVHVEYLLNLHVYELCMWRATNY